MAGYEVTDLSQPSWLATAENIELLAGKINSLGLGGDAIVVLELFGNSTFRFRQFDDTMALPFRSGNGYHMEGEVGVCDDTTFQRLLTSVRPILDSVGSTYKILIPPLPRYLYTGCCTNKKHCTNLSEEDYEHKLLLATMHFRPLIKDSLLSTGIENFFVLDGIGALLGIPAGENRGSASENLRDLNKYCAADGVHFNELGYANLAKVIDSAARGLISGTLTKARSASLSGTGKTSFFWRGFTSPNGHTGPRHNISNTISSTHHAIDAIDSDRSATLPGFVRGGSRGGPIRSFSRGGGRKLPYWKKK
jgi:hypothetical protein